MKIIKSALAVMLLFAVGVLFTGCNYDHELKNLDLLTAIGIDRSDEQYEVVAQVLKADQAVNESYSDSYRYFLGHGADFSSAVADICQQGPGQLTFTHNKLYLLSYEALDNMPELKKTLTNIAYDIRPLSYCVVVKNDLQYFMKAGDDYGFNCCYKLLDVLQETDNAPRIHDVVLALSADNKTILIPVVEVNQGEISIVKWLTVDQYGIHSEYR